MHGSLFKDRQVVTKNLLNLSNKINACLIRLNNILHYSYSLNNFEC